MKSGNKDHINSINISGLNKFQYKFGGNGHLSYIFFPETMSPLYVRSKVCMASFLVQSKVCIAPIQVWNKVCKFALHMDGSNADFVLHMEGGHVSFAPHMEWRHSFRDQIALPVFKWKYLKPPIY